MITKILNGNRIYNKMIINIKEQVDKCFNIYKIKPCLTIFLIGNDFSSNLYVKNKVFSCRNSYINFFIFKFSKTIKLKTLVFLITILNKNSFVDGILIQKPLPMRLDKLELFQSISFLKDVDLMNPFNFSNYIFGFNVGISPSINQAVFCFLTKLKINFNGLKVVFFGFSNVVGKPLCYEFILKGMSVSIVSKYDENFKNLSNSADIFIVAIGSSLFLSKGMISYGSIVIDIGINRFNNNQIIGDVDMYSLLGKVSWITPVPGGIGPLTISYLLLNTLTLCLRKKK